MTPPSPDYKLFEEERGCFSLALSGNWEQGQNPASFSTLQSELAGTHPARLIADGSTLGAWDSLLMAFLLQCHDHCQAQGIVFETRNVPEGIEKLLAVATAVKAQQP
ncbi:MAG: STAS domain-containing protein, partial [Halioglobus sp.]